MYPFIDIGGRTFGTYGLCMVIGLFVAGALTYRKGKANGFIIEDVLIIGAFALAFGLVCGGGMYVFVTYSIDQILAFIHQGDFHFLSGGIIFYGGLIGGVLGAFVGIRVTKAPLFLVEHSVVPFIPLGHAIGRVGCVLAGCCHGFAYEGPFALYYPHSVSGLSSDQGYFPVQPLESLLNIGICLFLLRFEKKCKKPYSLLFTYLSIYAICRFGLEFLRGDLIRGSLAGFSTSQWVSIGLLCISGAFFLIRYIFKNRHRRANKTVI